MQRLVVPMEMQRFFGRGRQLQRKKATGRVGKQKRCLAGCAPKAVGVLGAVAGRRFAGLAAGCGAGVCGFGWRIDGLVGAAAVVAALDAVAYGVVVKVDTANLVGTALGVERRCGEQEEEGEEGFHWKFQVLEGLE